MKLDIKTTGAEPRRQTYAYLARRFGEDRPATRYEEAVHALQSMENFHYRPNWEPEFELFDVRKTAIVMQDWHALLDPRQFYYATYNISRAGMEAANSKAFEFAAKQNLLGALLPETHGIVVKGLLPMRHYEWAANRINWSICDRGFGAPVTSAAAFAAMDRLGVAQILTRLGLELDGQTGSSLAPAKLAWLDDAAWQGVRRSVEHVLVVKDWFEAFVAQNFVLDGLVHRLVFDEFRKASAEQPGGMGLSLVTEMIADCAADRARWVDAVLKTAAAESAENKTQLGRWFAEWNAKVLEAAGPLAALLLGDAGAEALTRLASELNTRAAKLGLAEVTS